MEDSITDICIISMNPACIKELALRISLWINGNRAKATDRVEDGRGKINGMFVLSTTTLGAKNQSNYNSLPYNQVNLLESSSCVLWHQLLPYSTAHTYQILY